jgi:hypothetical protein
MPHDVFISYSSNDKAVADAACAALEAQKIRCWIAPRDVLAGKEYAKEIVEAINGCRVMVLVFSANVNTSPDIGSEVHLAFSRGIPIVSLRIENVLPQGAMEYRLSKTHWLDALTPPLEMRIGELVASVSRLLSRPDSAVGSATAPQPQQFQRPETADERFARFFAESPDLIAEVETQASSIPQQTVAECERLLMRLEIIVWPRVWKGSENLAHLEGLLRLIEQHDANLDEAKAFVSTTRQSGVNIDDFYDALKRYQRAIGEINRIRRAIVALGEIAVPLVCLAFRRFYKADAHNSESDGYLHMWRIELELADVLSQLKDFRALPFIADAMLMHQNDMNGHNNWGLGIVRAVQAFRVPRQTVDDCFERLVGVSASEILREKRDRDRH